MFLHHPFSTKLLKGVVHANSLYFHTCHLLFTLWSASAHLSTELALWPPDCQSQKTVFFFFFFNNEFLWSMTQLKYFPPLVTLIESNRKPNPSWLKQIQFITSRRRRLGGRVDSRGGCQSRSPVSPEIPVLSFLLSTSFGMWTCSLGWVSLRSQDSCKLFLVSIQTGQHPELKQPPPCLCL